MAILYKDGKSCNADQSQVDLMKKAGWSDKPQIVEDESEKSDEEKAAEELAQKEAEEKAAAEKAEKPGRNPRDKSTK